MTGLKKRVTLGFMGIVTLLFLSGMVSFFELNNLSADTDDILKANKRNMQLAHAMLVAAHSQNEAFVEIVAYGDRSKDSLCLYSHNDLELALERVRKETLDLAVVDSISMVVGELRDLTRELVAQPKITPLMAEMPTMDSLSRVYRRAVYDKYQPLYSELIEDIYDYMTSAQSTIAPRAEQLHRNAYRAVTPVFISLVVMIAIVLMLYYFMLIICVNPIIKMSRSLKDALAFNIPLAIKSEYRDEVQELKEGIETMAAQCKQRATNLIGDK
ncbi:MAG: hypothetical protein SNH88_04410 [Rikenellaceae bacterium]